MKKILVLLLLLIPSVCMAQQVLELDGRKGAFVKGIFNTYEFVPDGYIKDARNVYFDEEMGIVTRDYPEKYNDTQLNASKPIEASYEYIKEDGSHYMIVYSSGTVYYSDGDGKFTAIISTLNVNYTPSFTTAWDKLWWVTPEACYNWDGTTLVDVSTVVPKGRIICYHYRKLFVAGQTGYRSWFDYTEEDKWYSWPASYVEKVGSGDGDRITAMFSYRGNLYITKEHSTWAYLGTNYYNFTLRNISPYIGCLYKESIGDYQGYKIWLSHRGLELFDGSSFKLISQPIEDTIDSISQMNSYKRWWEQDTQAEFEAGTISTMTVDTASQSGHCVLLPQTDADDWNAGTLVNIDTYTSVGSLQLSTTGYDGFERYDNNQPPSYPWEKTVANYLTGEYYSKMLISTVQYHNGSYSLVSSTQGIKIHLHRNELQHSVTFYHYLDSGLFSNLYFGGKPDETATSFKIFNNWYNAEKWNIYYGENQTTEITGSKAKTWQKIVIDINNENDTFDFYVDNSLLCDDYAFLTGSGDVSIFAFWPQDVNTTGIDTYIDDFYCNTLDDQWLYENATFTSQPLNFRSAPSSQTWTSYGYFCSSATVPDGTSITYEVQSSSVPDFSGVNDYWCSISNYDLIEDTVPLRQYLRWRANFSTDYSTVTPILHQVYIGGYVTSQTKNAGTNWDSWGLFETSDVTTSSKTITYKVRAAGTEANLTDASLSCSSWTTISNGELITLSTGPWIQWQAVLATKNPASSPNLDNVTINWYDGEASYNPSAQNYDNRYWLAITTATKNNLTIIYDKNGAFTLFDGFYPSSFVKFRNDLYFGDYNGYVWKADGGTSGTMNAYIVTGDYDLGSPLQDKQLRGYYLFAKPQSVSIKTSYAKDLENSYTTLHTLDLSGTGKLKILQRPFSLGTKAKNVDNDPFTLYSLDTIIQRTEPIRYYE